MTSSLWGINFSLMGYNFSFMRPPTSSRSIVREGLTATTGAAATHAPVARSWPRHDGSTGSAAWRVAHVVHLFHAVGGVVDAAVGGVIRDPLPTVRHAAAGGEVGCDAVLRRGAVFVPAAATVVEDVLIGEGLVAALFALQDGLRAHVRGGELGERRGNGLECDPRWRLAGRLIRNGGLRRTRGVGRSEVHRIAGRF